MLRLNNIFQRRMALKGEGMQWLRRLKPVHMSGLIVTERFL